MAKLVEDSGPRSMRELVQKKFMDDVIGSAAGSNWLVLVLDDAATRVISSALAMFDIMEQRVTLVEALSKKRQPFREMDVVYIVVPTSETIQAICDDFADPTNPRYGGVHIYCLEPCPDSFFTTIRSNGNLCSRLKSFKEVNLNFISAESNVFHLDMPDTLSKLYGTYVDHPGCARSMARKLSTLCITLNEFPTIRYQSNSKFATETATTLNKILTDFKRANPQFWAYGDDGHQDRDRGQLLIVDRTFDPLSPLMHEYTYQAMIYDLLDVEDGVIKYQSETTGAGKVEKKALLNENDDLFVEYKHQHVAVVIEKIKERMNDIIQNNAGAALTKKSGADMSITDMAAAVKQLPEYRETMSKLSQHVHIAQRCMDAFSRGAGLMGVSQLEQTMSTGVDEEGEQVKGNKLFPLVREMIANSQISKIDKLRLLAIYSITQRNAPREEKEQLVNAARLDGGEQQILINFVKLSESLQNLQNTSAGAAKGATIFGGLFKGRAAPPHKATVEGEYADTRHVCRLRALLDQMNSNELPPSEFTALNANSSSGGESKTSAKSVRKYGANTRWGKKDQNVFTGGRLLVFIAGGVAYSELRVAHDVSVQHTKEVIVGGTHIINPRSYLRDVASMSLESTGKV